MSFNMLDALKGILTKEEYVVDREYNQFAINSYLGKYKQYIPILEQIMCLKLPNQAHYDYLRKMCGYGFPPKLELNIVEEPIYKYIMQFYECSRLDARDYAMFMSEQEKKDLVEYYEGD